jgi:hypothetical protein
MALAATCCALLESLKPCVRILCQRTKPLATPPTGRLDRVSAVPLSRWDADAPPPDPAGPDERQHRWGVFLPASDTEWCDAASLGLTPAEALVVDPQQRLLLEAFAEAHAGAEAAGLASRCVGLGWLHPPFVGAWVPVAAPNCLA